MMGMRAARFSQADVTRALRAARKEGMSIRIEPDGAIVVVPAELSPQVTGEHSPAPLAPKKEWRL